jgi:hypothetical protein
MSSTRPIRVNAMHGRITQGSYGKGSKSEHEAIFIETPNARYVLRPKTGHAYSDTKLRQFIGHEVECDGFLVGTTLLVDRIEEMD